MNTSYTRTFANGSAVAAAATSLGRVAQAGNGNCTSSGIGISGCETITEPGLRIPARLRSHWWEKAVFMVLGLRQIETANDAKAEFPTTRGSI
jgi:hypothetical protein